MKRRMLVLVLALLAHVLGWAAANAHEMRPAYLDLREVQPDRFDVMWKVPARGEARLAVYVRLPQNCVAEGEATRHIVENSYVERWSVTCAGGLRDGLISIDGLQATVTDALVRIGYANGTTEAARLKPDAPEVRIAGAQSSAQIARTYFLLGVDHILSGIDHLLFVLALMLLIRDRWTLIKTITAFTFAHSLTLAGVTLGWLSLPQAPVEAVIALSIAFVAHELVKMAPGERRLSEAYPWLIGFCFGLLHGFGFAGALKEIGLPQADVFLSLLMFNLGVEAGQLLFVGGMLGLWWVWGRASLAVPRPARLVAAYGIGSVAMVWFLERIAAFGQT